MAFQPPASDMAQSRNVITVLYFASVRTSIPGEPYSELVHLPRTPFPLSDLRTHLSTVVHVNNTEFATALDNSAWSVNEEMVDSDDEGKVTLEGGETVCPIPPVSGG